MAHHAITYGTAGLRQFWRQATHALRSRANIRHSVSVAYSRLRRDEIRIAARLGRQVYGLDILEIGPGQQCERARYFGTRNRVTGIDMDSIPRTGRLLDYARMLRTNGLGRVLKTLGRKALLVDQSRAIAWEEVIETNHLPWPKLITGNVCSESLPAEAYDLVVSWSVFEHLEEPSAALSNIVQSLRPGGVLYIGIHLYTSNSGHHDIRAFSGGEASLPLWAHLRDSTANEIKPSAFLNRLKLPDWRALFSRLAPGYTEFLEDYGADQLRAKMTPELRAQLSGYTDEELLTVDTFYCWKKPH